MPWLVAHDTAAHGLLWARWTFEPFTTVLLLASAVLYGVGLLVLWRRAGAGRGIRVWEAAAFYTGLLSIAIALASPLAWLSELLFSAHMTQHEVLMLIAAPLVAFGRPLQAFHWALPAQARERAGRAIRHPAVVSGWRRLTAPASAFLLHGAALWVWHIPRLFEAALANAAVHALQHASFLVTAILFWWGMLDGRYGRVGYGAGVLYVFLTALHSSLLGALLTIAPSPWYRAYAGKAPGFGLEQVEDQQLAGLLMWIPSGVVFIVLGLALLAAWLGESERRVRLGSVGR